VLIGGLGVSTLPRSTPASTWRPRPSAPSSEAALAAVATVASAFVVLCPVVHLWYFLMLRPFLATLRLGRPAMSALIAVSVVLGMVAPLDSSLHGAYDAIVLGCMTLTVLLPALLLTPRARDRIDRIASSRRLVLL
jgi:hypothetical protein